MCFTVSQVARRRANQLRDFVTVLELGTINLDYGPCVSYQSFRGGFHNAGFPRASRSEKKEISNRTAGRRHSRQVHLEDVDNLLDCLILTNNHPSQTGFERF